MRICVVGLGNPGKRYAQTPHNSGARVINHICDLLGATTNTFNGLINDHKSYFAIPTCYMNNSGTFIKNNVYADDKLCVIHDDLEIDPGKVKFKFGGSAAGHNGLRDIDRTGVKYLKIRIGVGRSEVLSVHDFVLNTMPSDSPVFEAEKSIAQFILDHIYEIGLQDPVALSVLYKQRYS